MSDMYKELQNAVVKAGRFNIQAFEVTILTDDGKMLRLGGNKEAIKKAKIALNLTETFNQQRAAREQKFKETFIEGLFKTPWSK